MRAAANYAWCNRQLLMHLVRRAFMQVFEKPAEALGLHLVYDVAHNIAKLEPYDVAQPPSAEPQPPTAEARPQCSSDAAASHPMPVERGARVRMLCVHRKGATRAFPPGHPEVPAIYRAVGQPVLVPGDMGRSSWVLVGAAGAMAETFGSTCHGAGRLMSRGAAIRAARGRSIGDELLAAGVIARARGRTGLAEEQPAAYKDVSHVVDVVARAGLAKKVARLRPIGVIKG
jgi:tRNA-splicing ligase RtcB